MGLIADTDTANLTAITCCPQWSLSRKSDTWRRMKGLDIGILLRRIWRRWLTGDQYMYSITPGAGPCYYDGHSWSLPLIITIVNTCKIGVL